MGNYRIAAIPGDGIGKEVITAGCQVLEHLASQNSSLSIEFVTFPWGSDYYLETGEMMPDDALDTLRGFDAIYFGSAGDPRVPDHITLWNPRLEICQSLDQYANIRPTKLLPGLSSPLKNGTPQTID